MNNTSFLLSLFLCLAFSESTFYFYTTPVSLRRFNPSTQEDVLICNRTGLSNTAFDSTNYKIFFRSKDFGILSCNYDGTQLNTVLSSSKREDMDIAFDSFSQHLFYVDNQAIRRCQNQGQADIEFFHLGNRTIGNVGIALDPQRKFLYFSFASVPPFGIYRISLQDASSLQVVDDSQETHTLAVHPITGDIYAVTPGNIWKYELANNYQKSLVAPIGDTGISIDPKGSIYVTDYSQKAVHEINSDGTIKTFYLKDQPWSGSIGTVFEQSDSEISSTKSSDTTWTVLIALTTIFSIVAVFSVIASVLFVLKRRLSKKTPVEITQPQEVAVKETNASPSLERTRTLSNVRRNARFNIEVQEGVEMFVGDWNGTRVLMKRILIEDALKLLKNEEQTLMNIKHPNCVLFLGTYTDRRGNNYIVTEYIQRSLKQLLEEKRRILTMIDLLDIAIGAAKGLAYLEEQNVLHRAISLRNMMVSESDNYVTKVTEFGLSRNALGGMYTVSGDTHTPIRWNAIEVIKGSPHTFKSDVWSFGVLLFEIFSFGKEPFEGMTNKEVYLQILSGKRLPRPETCPEQVYQVMKKCWLDDPSQRPGFVEILKEMKEIKNVFKRTQRSSLVVQSDSSMEQSIPQEDNVIYQTTVKPDELKSSMYNV